MNSSELNDIILAQLRQREPLWSNWYIGEKIGSGSYSTVYKIFAERAGRTDVSAMKVEPIVPSENSAHDPERRRRSIEQKRELVANESNIMHKLKNCPNIVSYEDEGFYDLIVDGNFEGYYFLLRMEYLSCLTDIIKSRGSAWLTEATVRKLAADIATGIKAAHDMGIIHRDLKPSNFFLDENTGTFKLGDFNISKETRFSRTFAGTNGYLAPEVYMAKSGAVQYYTALADIYSFGICLYVLMNDLYMPFEREYGLSLEQAVAHRMDNLPMLPPKNASPRFAAIILKACSFRKENRYQSMGELLRDLSEPDRPVVQQGIFRKEKPVRPVQKVDDDMSTYAFTSVFPTQNAPSGDTVIYERDSIAPVNTPAGAAANKAEQDYLTPAVDHRAKSAPAARRKKKRKKSLSPVIVMSAVLVTVIAAVSAVTAAVYQKNSRQRKIQSISPSSRYINMEIYEDIEITSVRTPGVIDLESVSPTFGCSYSVKPVTQDSSLTIKVSDGAKDDLFWDAPDGLDVYAKKNGNTYNITIDAADLLGSDAVGTIVFRSADGSVKEEVTVDVKSKPRSPIELVSSDPEIISFSGTDSYTVYSSGEVTVYWTSAGDIKYSKKISVIK